MPEAVSTTLSNEDEQIISDILHQECFYARIGVSKNATPQQIRRGYLSRSKTIGGETCVEKSRSTDVFATFRRYRTVFVCELTRYAIRTDLSTLVQKKPVSSAGNYSVPYFKRLPVA
ncbi:hypothetical protein SpCBS45565_g05902 [Spizellomyces sp. 'palustris']|nr:hypothetical protein SpCBS45565_g05902 [Spizellomyces sp. 'palustris']